MPTEQQSSLFAEPAPVPSPVAESAPTVRTGTCRTCTTFVWRPIGERGVTWPCTACGGVVDVTNPAPYLAAAQRRGT